MPKKNKVMKVQVKKVGDYEKYSISIPKEQAEELGLRHGDEMKFFSTGSSLVIEKTKKKRNVNL